MKKVIREGAMSDIDIMAGESKSFKDFVKEFYKEFKDFPKNREAMKWLEDTYKSVNESTDSDDLERVADGLPQTVEETINEMSINDPIMIKLRAAQMKRNKDAATKVEKEKKINPDYTALKNAPKIKELKKKRAQIMRDMEQEAEPEGGKIADRYGKELNKIDNDIIKLGGNPMKESVNEDKIDVLRKSVQKINRKYKVNVSSHPITKGEIEIILGSGNHPDSDYHAIEKLVSKLGIKNHSIFNESVNEGISVFDERSFGKTGIIVMIDDNGKKVSAIFKDKKNADKFNRNNPSDIKKLLDLAKKTKYPTAIDELAVNESSTINKRRAGAELKQKLKGKRSDGMGKYTATIYGLDSNGKRVELKSLNDLNKYSEFELGESVNEAQKINPTSMKFLKGMKKIKVKGLGGYMPGVDYVYVDGDKYYFVDFEGDHMELNNTNTIKQLHKLHGNSLGESVNEEQLDEKLITFSNRAPYGQIVFMAGGAGSGKGFAIDNFIDAAGFKVRDVDEMKTAVGKLDQLGKFSIDDWFKKYASKLPEEDRAHVEEFVVGKGMSIADVANNLKNPNNVAALHYIVHSMGLKDKWLINMLSGKTNKETLPNLLFDITAKKVSAISDVIKPLVDAGYDPKNIHLIWVLTDYHLAVSNNKDRKRVVPDDILLGTHEGTAKTIWSILTKGLPSGLNGRIDVILNNRENTVTYNDSKGNKMKGAVKGFLSLPVKKQGGGILPEKVWKELLYTWISDNGPKTIDLSKPLDRQMGK